MHMNKKIVSLVAMGLIGGTAAVLVTSSLQGCAQAAKTVLDVGAETACVITHWGESPEQMATDCFQGGVQVAIDTIADEEVLLQKNGAKPTAAYRTDARVQQKVLAALAPTAPTSVSDAGK